jgi:hypothetical protein
MAADGVEVEVNPALREIRPGLLRGNGNRYQDPWRLR